MSIYSLERIEQVRGIQVFEKLVVNGIAPFDRFVENLENVYRSELMTLYKYMEVVANLQPLPANKFHPYDDGKDGYREFEFKTKHLRVYVIAKPGGKIVVLGGTKANQAKDQVEFRRLKRGYINSL